MREMKDSGVAWLGDIPQNWSVVYPKALFSLRKDRATEGERQLTASQQLGIIYQDEYMAITGQRVVVVEKDFSILKHVEAGDFVISMRSFQGGLEYSTVNGSISSAYVMLIPNVELVYSPFFKWLFKSVGYIKALQSTSDLIRDGQAMRYSNFIQVPLFIAPIEEQKKIADYLDEKCKIVDALIANQQAQIEKLKQYKQSLITEVVTKGLDPNAPMKDSGVEWIGTIPETWECKPIKFLSSFNDETLTENTDPDYEFDYIEIGSVEFGKGIIGTEHMKFSDAPSRARRIVKENDIIVSTVRTYLKAVAPIPYSEDQLIASTGFVVIRPRDIEPSFLRYAILSTSFISRVEAYSVGISYPAINAAQVVQFRVPVPSRETQIILSSFLDGKCHRIDKLIEIKSNKIEMLGRYKKSLIYEHVTGKKEVS